VRRAARTDNTASALVAYAKSLGFDYLPINGVVDGVLAYGHLSAVIDWKSPDGELTKEQAKLIARGFPLRFISKPEQLDALRSELMRGR
jgi:hypothetical protein